jgi:uncharacterized protein YndB with AHSA1/START domain
MASDKTVAEISRRFAAAPEEVFAAFADPHLVSRWLTPSPEITLSVLQFDFRVGGTYRFAYHVPGRPSMTVRGTYRAIERPSRIAFSWIIDPPDEHAGLESEVTVIIRPHGTGAELFIRHEKLTRLGAAERHSEGWRGALDRLTVLLGAESAHER